MRAVFWLPALLLMGVLWFLGSSSAPLGMSLPHPFDWLGHALLYALLTLLLRVATGSGRAALTLALWVAAFDEVHRAFVPGQDAGIQAWLFALAVALLASRRRNRQAQTEAAFSETEYI